MVFQQVVATGKVSLCGVWCPLAALENHIFPLYVPLCAVVLLQLSLYFSVRLSARQLIPRRISERVCMYVYVMLICFMVAMYFT